MDAASDSPIRPLDVDALAASFGSAEPFPFVQIDDFLEPAFAAEVAAAYPTPEQAEGQGRTFDAVNERGKTQICDPERFPPPVRRLHEALASPEWLAQVEAITGIPGLVADPELAGGGMHVMAGRSHLDVHVDFNRLPASGLFRRLNILVFLNDVWDSAWGGNLELWNRSVDECTATITPLLNRCVMFQTSEHSFHGVEPLDCPPGHYRRSFAAYYYTAEAPASWDGTAHTTIFRARPDEHAKRLLTMPLERAARGLRRAREKVRGRG